MPIEKGKTKSGGLGEGPVYWQKMRPKEKKPGISPPIQRPVRETRASFGIFRLFNKKKTGETTPCDQGRNGIGERKMSGGGFSDLVGPRLTE